jgi:hypothetical protein
MVRYNNTSVLRRLDLDNLTLLRRIMGALALALENSSTTRKQALDLGTTVLTPMEGTWVRAILNAINRNTGYPLLRDAIVRFSAARLGSAVELHKATKELENVADEYVLIVPESHIEEYVKALRQFETLPWFENQLLGKEAQVWHLNVLFCDPG